MIIFSVYLQGVKDLKLCYFFEQVQREEVYRRDTILWFINTLEITVFRVIGKKVFEVSETRWRESYNKYRIGSKLDLCGTPNYNYAAPSPIIIPMTLKPWNFCLFKLTWHLFNLNKKKCLNFWRWSNKWHLAFHGWLSDNYTVLSTKIQFRYCNRFVGELSGNVKTSFLLERLFCFGVNYQRHESLTTGKLVFGSRFFWRN